jgi:signal transduction histidine kinase
MPKDLEAAGVFDPAFLESTTQQAVRLLRARGGGFFLCNPTSGEAVLAAAHNLVAASWDEQLLRKVCQSRRTVIRVQPDTPDAIAVPSIWHGAVRGVLLVVDDSSERVLDDQDAALLRPLADLAAGVLHQAERLVRMTAQFRALHAIDVALTSSLQLDRVLDLILEQATGLVEAEHGSLRLVDRETGELVLKAHLGEGWTPEIRAYRFQVGQGITGWVAEHLQPYLCPDARQDAQNVVLFEDMRSGVAVPLLLGTEAASKPDQLLGVLLLESSRLAAFDRQDIELLEALAQQAVIAIQNATQHEELQLMHRALQDEHERRVAAEKWTVMGQAATALAHRINNLMGIVPASASEIQRVLSGLEIADADREWIEANLERIQRNGRFILKLSDALFRPFQDPGPSASFDVNRLLKEALQEASLPDTVQVIRDYEPEIPQVESSSLLVDVFLELLSNALRAMAEKEQQRLSLRTWVETEESDCWVVVEIGDTGGGIPAEHMKHLWDMFKEGADGLGFGLWWVRTFIERHGGTITCDSMPDVGTTFTVRLPAHSTEQVLEK